LDPESPGAVPVTVRLSPRQYDAVDQMARVTRKSVPEVIRSLIGLGRVTNKRI
jgi:hypothetical protein